MFTKLIDWSLTWFFIFQGIIPSFEANQSGVEELFIYGNRLSSAIEEAAELPQVEISTLDLMWVQVRDESYLTLSVSLAVN